MATPARTMEYLDLQAQFGISKHFGGFRATRELLASCRAHTAREVLYVGCGIGVGPAFIAKTLQCNVIAFDISERMVAWSRQRVRGAGVADRVALCAADVLHLPFGDDRFDVVLVESVLEFVAERPTALQECVRVTRPGGYVGVNEAVWLRPPTSDQVNQARMLGTDIPTAEDWQALWDDCGLTERVATIERIDVRTEMRERVEWIGWRWLLRAWARGLVRWLTDPRVRRTVREQLSWPTRLEEHLAFGLYAGRKPDQWRKAGAAAELPVGRIGEPAGA